MKALELFFLRHGIAVERESGEYRDEDRPLTDKGRRRMIEAIRGMKRMGLKIDALISSPLLRALQTAELVREHLPFEGLLELHEELKPEGSLKNFLEQIKARRENRLMLVGHEPSLSSWILSLLGCRKSSLELRKGGLCRLRLAAEDSASSELIYLLQPKQLRAMARRD